MLLIKSMGRYNGDEKVLTDISFLPKNASMLNEGKNINVAGLKGMLCIIPLLFVMGFVAKNVIDRLPGSLEMNLEFACTFILMIILLKILSCVHELIHALMYPSDCEKQIWKFNGGYFVYCNAEISKNRFIVLSVMPMILLGIIPFICWSVLTNEKTPWSVCALLLSFAMVFIAAGDIYNVINVIKKVPKKATVVNYGLHTYYIRKEDVTKAVRDV